MKRGLRTFMLQVRGLTIAQAEMLVPPLIFFLSLHLLVALHCDSKWGSGHCWDTVSANHEARRLASMCKIMAEDETDLIRGMTQSKHQEQGYEKCPRYIVRGTRATPDIQKA